MATGADLLLGALGADVVFGLPGVHNLPLWAALDRSPVRLVSVRHEQAAAYAADGYARATGRVGVALVTTGPGAANTLAACGEAWASGSPVLVIATDIPTALRRPGVVGGSLHEGADQAAMFAPVTKARFRAERAEEVGAVTAQAVAAALAAPQRPVLLEVPTDLLAAAVGDGAAVPPPPAPDPAAPDPAAVARATALLAAARRPLVWAGGGAVRAGAGDEVRGLARRLGAPLLETYAARGLGAGEPLAPGLPPHLPAVGALWDEADCVVAVGSDLDGMSTQNWRQPRPPVLVAVNVDAADAGKNYPADAVVVAGAAEGTRALRDALPAADRVPWAAVASARELALAAVRDAFPVEARFLDAFAGAAEGALVLADMCVAGYWLAGMLPVAGPRRLQYPMGWGTLGYALPAAIGAACAGAGPVVAVCGDGGAMFALGELATFAQEGLDVTLVIVDDGGYGMLRFDQRRTGAATTGTDLRTPDFAALAGAFGLPAVTVDGLGAPFAEHLAAALAAPGPSVLVARAALEPPPTTSPRWYRTGPPAWAPALPAG